MSHHRASIGGETMEFLKAMHYGANSGFLTIWEKEHKSSRHFDLADPEWEVQVCTYVDELLCSKRDVYYGVCTRAEGLNAQQRGTREQLYALPALWADVDIAGEGHASADYPNSKEEALELIAESGLPEPSIIIDTGGGLHVYWLLIESFLLCDDEAVARAESLAKRLQQRLRQPFDLKGYKVDSTADLPRVLRLPDTTNYKIPEQPMDVKVLAEFSSEQRYEFDELELALPAQEQQNAIRPCYKQDGGKAIISLSNCLFLQYCEKEATRLSEPEWHAMVSNLTLAKGGAELIHQLSSSYPSYSYEETEQKIRRALKTEAPHTCDYIQSQLGFTGCPIAGCPVKAPIAWANSRIGIALDTLNDFLENPEPTLDTLYETKMLEHLATLRLALPAKFEQMVLKLEQRFKKAGFSKRKLENLLKPFEKQQSEKIQSRRKLAENTELEIYRDIIGFAPVLPNGYLYDEGLVKKRTTEGAFSLGNHMVWISSLFDGRNQSVELAFNYLSDEWRKIIVSRTEISSIGEIVKLSAQGLPFTANNARLWIDFLHEFLGCNQSEIPQKKASHHYGWQEDGGFLPGTSNYTVIPNGQKFPVDFSTWQKGTLEEWREIAQAVLNEPIARTILAASFAAPLAEILGVRTFILHVYGPSQGGKTAAMTVAASVWGKPKEQLMNFNATKVAIEKTAIERHNLPLIIDERQAVGDNQSFLDGLVYVIGEGQGRARGTRDGGVQQGGSWCTITITSGEDPLSGTQSRQGVATRALELYTEKVFADSEVASSMYKLENTAYGIAGPIFIDWVRGHREDIANTFHGLQQKIGEEFPALSKNDCSYFGVLVLADIIQTHLFFDGTLPQNAEDLRVPDYIKPLIVQRADSLRESDMERAFEFIKSEVAANFEKFDRIEVGVAGKMSMIERPLTISWGWYEEDKMLYIYVSTMREIVEKGKINLGRFNKDAIKNNWVTTGNDRNSTTPTITRQKTPDSPNTRVYAFNTILSEMELDAPPLREEMEIIETLPGEPF